MDGHNIPTGPAALGGRKRHKKRNRPNKEAQRKSLNTQLTQLTTALENMASGKKKDNPAKREKQIENIARIKAQLNELDQQPDDLDSTEEAVTSLQSSSSNGYISSASPSPASLPQWNRIYGNTNTNSGSVSSTTLLGQHWNRTYSYGQPIPPPAGMTSVKSQPYNPGNGFTHVHSQSSGGSTAATTGQQWPSNNGQPYASFDPAYSDSLVGQQWRNSSAHSHSSSTLPSGAPSFWQQGPHSITQSTRFSLPSGVSNFDQQRGPSGQQSSLSPVTKTSSGAPLVGNQWHPSTAYVPPTSRSAAASSSIPYFWDSMINPARSSQGISESKLHDYHPSPLIHQPTQAPDVRRQAWGSRMDVAKTAPKMLKDDRSDKARDRVATWKDKRPRDVIVPPSEASGGVPEPSEQYISRCSLPPVQATSSREILLIIDLNGTILHRPDRTRPTHFIERTGTKFFLQYVLDNFNVMIWSSAKPENVNRMCQALFPGALRQKLVAAWGRDRMGLSPGDYGKRVQVYKRLGLVWSNLEIQMGHPESALGRSWDQTNTVLLDDSQEKARSEPHNLVQVPEFEGKPEEPNLLGLLAQYLTALKVQKDVSTFMRESPFEFGKPL